ncbi:hypothetical protein [Diaphorobacter sp. LR2014-1]|nr:hypothetical protein [Diaphorobacter sp. LR2014-1]
MATLALAILDRLDRQDFDTTALKLALMNALVEHLLFAIYLIAVCVR